MLMTEAERAGPSRAGWAVSRVLEELYWRRPVFHYCRSLQSWRPWPPYYTLLEQERSRRNEKSFPGEEAQRQLAAAAVHRSTAGGGGEGGGLSASSSLPAPKEAMD